MTKLEQQHEGNAEAKIMPLQTPEIPTFEPYMAKLERFELFSTNQCYYLVGCNKQNTTYRVLKMDRTLIERPPEYKAGSSTQHLHHPQQRLASDVIHASTSGNGTNSDAAATQMADNSHTAKPTLRPLSDFLTEDPNVYSQEEIKDMLDMIHAGNRITRSDGKPNDGQSGGGLKPIVKAYGIVGFIRFLDCYYLTLITRRAKVGSIGDNGIYTIKNTETIPLKPSERRPGSEDNADPSSVLLSMWNRGKRSVGLGLTNREIAELRYQGLYQVVDLTKNFYFSYTYDLTCSLQDNFLATTAKPFPPPPFKDMYAWNYFLTREFEVCLTTSTSYHWVMPIIHGAYVQRKVNDYGHSLNIILLARRSRHFAGTRYLKRGVSEQGKVANDVEHEQILHDESTSSQGIFSSYLQVRGSIPTFWTQESSVTMPKPPIELNRVDPTYTATQLHFGDLLQRYSSPILVLDLVKQSEKREREVRVGNEYRHAIDYINQTIDEQHKIRYCALDYSHISKHRNLDVSYALNEVSTWAVNQTGFFCSMPKWKIVEGGSIQPFQKQDGIGATRLAEQLGVPVFPMEQNGVLRTNCIDCLDRTNVAQFSAGVEAVGQQLVVMGIRSRGKIGPSSSIVRVLIDMYVDIGDSIALQYGGSEAHKKVVTAGVPESNITGPIGKHKELLTSIRRYYSNAFTDRLKQDAMNLFLGYYLPYCHVVPLWEMENDYYLHNFHVKEGRGKNVSMRTYELAFGIDGRNDDLATNSKPSRRSYGQYALKSVQGSIDVPRSGRQLIGESKRVERVRNRCKEQNVALSTWWKTALQSNVKQRLWMRLGGGHEEYLLPPRFERVYQPEKIGQFDRLFSRAWENPVRRTHAAQHSEGTEDDDAIDLLRVISADLGTMDTKQEELSLGLAMNGVTLLSDHVAKHGFNLQGSSKLERFSKHFRSVDDGSFSTPISEAGYGKIPEEYTRYCAPSCEVFSNPSNFEPDRIQEFQKELHDFSLTSDDVDGIRKLARSAHLGEIISDGQYRGLNKETSAIEVATSIHENFNALGSLPRGGGSVVQRELLRRRLNKAGVRETISSGWANLSSTQKLYHEIVEAREQRCVRSDLTTSESFRLYTCQFDSSTPLTTSDQIYLQTFSPSKNKERKPLSIRDSTSQTSFVQKAARLGFSIKPHSSLKTSTNIDWFGHKIQDEIAEGFEQINEDMFSRKDNKFMVFNRAGMNSWSGSCPVTKISQADTILMSTLS